MSCSLGSTISCFLLIIFELLMFCLQESTIGFFSLMFSPLAACAHGSTLGDFFNYEDKDHVVIITNLNENAYDLNMKIADLNRTNTLALPPIWRRSTRLKDEACCHCHQLRRSLRHQHEKGGYASLLPTWTTTSYDLNVKVADSKRSNMVALSPIWRGDIRRRCFLLEGGVYDANVTSLKEDASIANAENEVILSFSIWRRTPPTWRRRLTAPLMLTQRMRWTTWKKRPCCHYLGWGGNCLLS